MLRFPLRSLAIVSLGLALVTGSGCGDDSSGGEEDAARPDAATGHDATVGRPDGQISVVDGGEDDPDADDDQDADVDADVPEDADVDAGEDGSVTNDAGPDASTEPVLVTTGGVVGRLVPTSASTYITALCTYYARCEPTFYPGLSLNECRALLSQPCLAVPYVVLNEADGADACVERLNNASCNDSIAGDIATGACGQAFDLGVARLAGVSSVSAPGGECGDGRGCQVGSVCSVPDNASCGMCVALKADGAACTAGQCLEGGCANGQCKQPALENAACTVENVQGGANRYCAAGLTCNANNRCVKLALDGANCTANELCLGGRCVSGKCADLAAYGAACTTDDACVSGLCFDGHCAIVASCDVGAAGEPCPTTGCGAGLFCNDHRCTATAPTDCTTTGCNAATYCNTDGATPVCTPLKVGTAECDAYGQCADGDCSETLHCGKVGIFQPCDQDTDCLSGTCLDNYCRGGSSCE